MPSKVACPRKWFTCGIKAFRKLVGYLPNALRRYLTNLKATRWTHACRRQKSEFLVICQYHKARIQFGSTVQQVDFAAVSHTLRFDMTTKFDNAYPDGPCICSRCKADLQHDFNEVQERLEICFRAGYGSVFGDENVVRGTFCQRCFQGLLGPWLQILADTSYHRIREVAPIGVFQAYQFTPTVPEKRRTITLPKRDKKSS